MFSPTRQRMAGLLIGLAACMPVSSEEPPPREITVFAAVSLTNALEDIGEAYRAETGSRVRFSFAASSALARQVESGAPADAFVSADVEWMDYLANKSLINLRTRRNVAGNELVLIAPADSDVKLEIAPGFPIAEALGKGRLAVADPASVPAGRYAKAALESLGVWPQLESHLVPAENVRAALAYVSRGEVPLGIVYRTDAGIEPKVKVIGAFPAGSHPPIVYPAASIGTGNTGGTAFVDYLAGEKAQATFRKYGFTMAR